MTTSLERSRKLLISSSHSDRVGSLQMSSKSNEHSPRHQTLSLTPTNASNYEQSKGKYTRSPIVLHLVLVFAYRSYPYLSISQNGGAESTMVPTSPADPSVTNLGLLSPSSISNASVADSQHQQFKKSSSMRFAKLMQHPSE
jgi:hypothetical protein